mmetsp:Transcript_119146/g.332440  ORF Transcript_119146/g.332440 Transcript_119146/m.332440 type:complete len:216 (-) Transcript_119146:682-1329(-)
MRHIGTTAGRAAPANRSARGSQAGRAVVEVQALVEEAIGGHAALARPTMVDHQDQGVRAKVLQLPLHQHLGLGVQGCKSLIDQQDLWTVFPQEDLPDEFHLPTLAARQRAIPIFHLNFQLRSIETSALSCTAIILAVEFELAGQLPNPLLVVFQLLSGQGARVPPLQQPRQGPDKQGAIELLGDLDDVIRRQHQAPQLADLQAVGQHCGRLAATG